MGQTAAPATERRRTYDQSCPVAHSLDLLGERWTLLIVRDLMFGPLRFTDLRDGLPGLAPNLLSQRLAFLVDRGVLQKFAQSSPGSRHAYRLTARGRELAPVIHALARFGVDEWTDPDRDPPPSRLLRGALLALMTPEALGDAAWSAALELPEASLSLHVRASNPNTHPLARLRIEQHPPGRCAPPDPPGDAPAGPDSWAEGAGPGATAGATACSTVVTSTLGTLRDLRRGSTTTRAAERAGSFSYRGSSEVRAQLAALFGWEPPPRR